MLERARFLGRAGYAVLLVDLRAHGETPGEAITFGYRESRDVAAAARWLRSRSPERPVYAIGVSMGGAAIVLADPPLPFDAVVGELIEFKLQKQLRDSLTKIYPVKVADIRSFEVANPTAASET